MAGAVVELDTALFRELYPRYAAASDALIEHWWDVACQIVNNSPASPIPYAPPSVNIRKALLYVLLCHLAELDQRGAGLVGRLGSAAEGSVNAQLASGLDAKAGPAWWQQSQCGATAWQMLKPYRTGGLYFHGGCKY